MEHLITKNQRLGISLRNIISFIRQALIRVHKVGFYVLLMFKILALELINMKVFKVFSMNRRLKLTIWKSFIQGLRACSISPYYTGPKRDWIMETHKSFQTRSLWLLHPNTWDGLASLNTNFYFFNIFSSLFLFLMVVLICVDSYRWLYQPSPRLERALVLGFKTVHLCLAEQSRSFTNEWTQNLVSRFLRCTCLLKYGCEVFKEDCGGK